MLLHSHISAYARCFARKVCNLVRATGATSLGEDKLGARDKILNTKIARRACTGRAHAHHTHKFQHIICTDATAKCYVMCTAM